MEKIQESPLNVIPQNENKTLSKNQVIDKIKKIFVSNGFDNKNDWRYIQKEVRKKLNLKDFKTAKKLPTFLTIEEVRQLLETAFQLKNKNALIFETIVKTGLRNAELCSLRLEDIDFQTGIFKVVEGKGKKDRYGIIPNSLLRQLIIYKQNKENGYLFISQKKGKYSTRQIQRIIKDIALKTGIKKEISPHTLRHSYATLLIEWGVDTRKIQELLGHANLETTQIYTHLNIRQLTNEVKLLDQI